MTLTAIVECPNCKGLLLASASQKTKTCPYCQSRLELSKVKRLARAESAMKASEILRKLKAERQSNPKKPKKTNQQS
ncbi:MAG TPA: DUF1922 domain-containing protein [Candidatus Nanoarchaeia archaeon]|nr:DUF1922 domain-containing protein [Candidatus Nanoarchaeia archaeon]